jgi:perosamine synthetase
VSLHGWRRYAHEAAMAYLRQVTAYDMRPRTAGRMVARLEEAFARYVGAKHAIAMTNGTATLEVAVYAIGDGGQKWATTPLTMSATAAGILAGGGRPLFCDVNPSTWLLGGIPDAFRVGPIRGIMSVSLFGAPAVDRIVPELAIDDAAQSLRKHSGCAFTSYSFQSSKHISSGEGGMLVTNDDELAARARSFASLGYDLSASSRIDRMAIRDPEAIRHVRFGINARMNDVTAAVVLAQLEVADEILAERAACAEMYRQAHQGCSWLTPQHVPDGATHAWWCYPLLIDRPPLPRWVTPENGYHVFAWVADAIVRHGGEKPYACWRLTYDEPAYTHLRPAGGCPVAESIQPRLLLFQTNDLTAAERNAEALRKTIKELGG